MQIQELKKYRLRRLAQIRDFQHYKEELLNPKERAVRINRAVQDYNFFCTTYFAHLMSPAGQLVANAPFHLEAAKYIHSHPEAQAVFEWARAHAKSTHISLLIPLWLKIQKAFKVMLLVGKSQDMAIRLLGDLQIELSYNERYIADFGEQIKKGEWEESHFVTQDNIAFFALGRGQSPRGMKYASNRPDYIVVDDIDDDELVRNPARVKQVTEWLLSAVYNTMRGGKGRFIVVGNRIGRNSVIASLADNPAFHHSVVNALDIHGKATWKNHYSTKELNQVRNTIGELAWQKEYMNNPILEGSIFKEIKWTKPLALRHYAYLVCYTDPSFKNTDKSDYKATVLIGKTRQGHYHILKAYVRKASVMEMVSWHYALYEELQQAGAVCSFFMEANYVQDMLLETFVKEGKQRRQHLPIQGDKRAKPDKFLRISHLQPYISNGILMLNETEKNNTDMRKLEEQFLLFEKGSRMNDDAPDAVEGAIYIINQKTHQELPIHTMPRNKYQNRYRF